MDTIIKIVIPVISFGFIYFLFMRKDKKINPIKKWKFWMIWILTSILIYGVLVVSLFTFFIIDSRTPSRAFSSDEWKADPEKRIELIDNLIETKQIDRQSKQEIIDLLGEPDGGSNTQQNSITYYLGPERGFFSIDSEWLSIWFKGEVVDRYELWRD